jgi:hypothetical protein
MILLRRPVPIFGMLGLLAGCAGEEARGRQNAAVGAAAQQTEFAGLVERLSESGGFFDTDNLISNETSYLHVMGKMREMDVTGGAYIGVGPGQNFSYIAQIRPRIAFIVDIRRDNLLHHLLYKALFELAGSRVEYLSMLLGRPMPEDVRQWEGRSVADLVAYVDGVATDARAVRSNWTAVQERLVNFGFPLDDRDLETIERFHDTFIRNGLSLRFNSFGRAPQPYYPTLRELILERDLTGKQANYLASEEGFQFLKAMQHEGMIVPVVGNLAGTHAVRAVAGYVDEIGDRVSAFYTSNVEFYVVGDGLFGRFVDNVAALPRDERSVIIRSYFGRGFQARHPQAVAGYYSTQLLQTVESFVAEYAGGGHVSYGDVVTRHALPLR